METKEEVILTGFTQLDELTGGFRKGELIFLAGRANMGAFSPFVVVSDIEKYCKKNNLNVYRENKELDSLFTIFREFELINIKIRKYGIQSELKIPDLKLIEDFYLKKLFDINKNTKPDLIIICAIGLGTVNKYSFKFFKKAAKELNLPILVFTIKSNSPDKQKDKYPTTSDFFNISKENIEKYNDKILFIYRNDNYDLSKSEKTETAEIIVAKNNNGKTGTVNLLFDKKKQKYINLKEKVFVFDRITSLSKTSFTAKYGNYWFEIDTNGNILYKIKCQNLRRISENLLIAKINNKEGLIDNNFNIVTGFKYGDFKTLDKNFEYFKFRENNKWGVADRNENIIIEPQYDSLKRADKNFNYMYVTLGEDEFLIDRKENVIDEETAEQLICTPEFVENKSDSEKLNWQIIEIKGKYGLVDENFNQLKISMKNIEEIPEKIINGL